MKIGTVKLNSTAPTFFNYLFLLFLPVAHTAIMRLVLFVNNLHLHPF